MLQLETGSFAHKIFLKSREIAKYFSTKLPLNIQY